MNMACNFYKVTSVMPGNKFVFKWQRLRLAVVGLPGRGFSLS